MHNNNIQTVESMEPPHEVDKEFASVQKTSSCYIPSCFPYQASFEFKSFVPQA